MTIVGINEVGQQASNGVITKGRDLPWLQDSAEEDVWGRWPIAYRDVVVLDGHNERVGILNLTSHDLAEPANRVQLLALLDDAAP